MSVPEYPQRLNVAVELVDTHLEQGRGEKPAILCGERTVTYAELAENVNRFGNALKELGVRIEERVAILMPDSPECVFAFFGAIKMGAVAIPFNTLSKPEDYEYLLNDSRARVLVVHSELLDRIEPIRMNLQYMQHVIVVGERTEKEEDRPFQQLLDGASAELEPADTSKDDAAFWIYSSGTTGKPKGAIHLHHDMLVEADMYAKQTLALRESDVGFSVAKLFFAYGLGNGLYFSLRVGATTILLPDRPTPDKVFELLDRYQPTVFYSVPTSYVGLLHLAEQTGRTSLGRVRMCVSAGEPLPKGVFDEWQERFGLEILDGIGSTEILHIYISNRPEQARAGSTGQLVPGYEAKIVDDEGRPLPAGQEGTLMIKGDSIADGYWNKHEETKRTFCGEWINTRDKFRCDEDGFFWYAGRADDMMKVSGNAVWPSDVEHTLQLHPAVLESGVVGAPDENGLIKPHAYVVLKSGYSSSEELILELQNFVKQNAAPYKYPRRVHFVKVLPRTATGKIKRYLLAQKAVEES